MCSSLITGTQNIGYNLTWHIKRLAPLDIQFKTCLNITALVLYKSERAVPTVTWCVTS